MSLVASRAVGCLPTAPADPCEEIDLEVAPEVHLALGSGEILRPFSLLHSYRLLRPQRTFLNLGN